jgi:hypothetical protein
MVDVPNLRRAHTILECAPHQGRKRLEVAAGLNLRLVSDVKSFPSSYSRVMDVLGRSSMCPPAIIDRTVQALRLEILCAEDIEVRISIKVFNQANLLPVLLQESLSNRIANDTVPTLRGESKCLSLPIPAQSQLPE